jgi:hypothetical protein
MRRHPIDTPTLKVIRHQSSPAHSSGDSILSAQTSTLIGAENGIKTVPQYTANVAVGSLADIGRYLRDVSFTPESGHSRRKM